MWRQRKTIVWIESMNRREIKINEIIGSEMETLPNHNVIFFNLFDDSLFLPLHREVGLRCALFVQLRWLQWDATLLSSEDWNVQLCDLWINLRSLRVSRLDSLNSTWQHLAFANYFSINQYRWALSRQLFSACTMPTYVERAWLTFISNEKSQTSRLLKDNKSSAGTGCLLGCFVDIISGPILDWVHKS